MGLAKYKNPVEYSFQVWVRSIKEDYEPVGVDYFLEFIRNVIKYHANTWKNQAIFKERILKELPNMNRSEIDDLWGKFECCLSFHNTTPYPSGLHLTIEPITKGHYIEHSYENGNFREKLIPIPKL